jgi:hypothetical protein
MDDESREVRDKSVKSVHEFLHALTIRSNILSTAFSNLVDALNNEDWAAVRDLLDENVQLTSLDYPTTYVGKGRVVAYIKTKIAKDEPVLITQQVYPDAITGIVTGNALWVDNDNGRRTISPITYKFIFVLHSDNNWYAVNLSGSPD